MLLSASWINDAGILPGFSMPGLIRRMNASRRKHNENMQLRPSFVSHKLWNFPEARELDTNRADCLSGQIGCTRMTEPPTVCLQVNYILHLKPLQALNGCPPPSLSGIYLPVLTRWVVRVYCCLFTFNLVTSNGQNQNCC